MRRLPMMTVAISLLVACTPDKPAPEASEAGEAGDESGTTEGDDSSEPGQSQTQAGLAGTETGDTTGDGESTGCNFVCPETGGDEGGQCDNWAQDCPDEMKCSAFANDGGNSWNSLKCVPVEPNAAAPGEPCTAEGNGLSGVDSCQEGAMCWDIDTETGQGICVALCSGSPEQPSCPEPDDSCAIVNEGVLNLCLDKCDPLLQDCPDGDACLPNQVDPNSFICVFDASGETGKAFDMCEFANACDTGLICVVPSLATECDPQAGGCCLPFCDTEAPSCPGAGQECLPWYEPDQAPPGYEKLGVCGLPS